MYGALLILKHMAQPWIWHAEAKTLKTEQITQHNKVASDNILTIYTTKISSHEQFKIQQVTCNLFY